MNSPLHLFDALPMRERLFVRGRLWTAPLDSVAVRVPPGRVLDVGCGHGAMIALLLERGVREVKGIDVDPRKIEWAKASVGRDPRTSLEFISIEALAAREPHSFDAVLAIDVLYLLPRAAQISFLTAARDLLRPGGVVLLHEAEADGSWKQAKCEWQEWVTVTLLGRTTSSGTIGLSTAEDRAAMLAEAGLKLRETVRLGRGYTTPHVLYEAVASAP